MSRFILYFLLLTGIVFAQKPNDIGIRQWKDHLGFYSCNSVSALGPFRIASNFSSLILYNIEDKSMKKMNRINGLSDVGIRTIRSSPDKKYLIIAYENSNLDILDVHENITNFSDIKNKTLNGNKIINDITFYDGFAYLACGFGILKFNYIKNEIKDTYIIGPGGSYREVYQVCLTDSVMFAATPNGLYRCRYKQKDPSDFQNWQWVNAPNMRQIPFSGVCLFNGKVLAAQSQFIQNSTHSKDTLFIWDGTSWQIFGGKTFPYTIKKMGAQNGLFWVIDQFGLQIFENHTAFKDYITTYPGTTAAITDAYVEITNGIPQYWISDVGSGFLKMAGSSPYYTPEYINTGGIRSSKISNIDVFNGKVAVSPIFIENAGGAQYNSEGISILEPGSEWKNLRKPGHPSDTLSDICHVFIDRNNPDILWASSWLKGLAEFHGNDLYATYNEFNTGGTISPVIPGWWRASGKDMDEDGNLWFSVSDVPEYICVRTHEGIFQKFNPDGLPRFVRKVLVTQNNDVWVLHERDQGITVLRPKKNGSYFSIEKIKFLNKNEGSGNLGSNAVYSAVQDADGSLWVGTSTGIRVFTNPNTVFDEPDGQPIKIIQGVNVELLLEGETITCMDVDAAQQKWVGTYSGGVYCFSPNGQTTIHHFTSENSPLYSNEIIDLKIDQKTGDVYIATPFGLQSYRNVYIEPFENYAQLHAFPNPVKKGYSGNVYITGLMDHSQVKITDLSGQLVWEGKAPGGRLEWPLVNVHAQRVVSGVYVVYAALTTGESKKLGKILVQ